MRFRSVLPGALAFSALWLAACGNDTPTAPTLPMDPAGGGTQMAVASNSWLTLAYMPVNRTSPATAVVSNPAGQSIVYAIGGLSSHGPVAKVTAYNVATNTWTFRQPLPQLLARTNGAGVINGKIYVTGGYQNRDFPGKTVYVYDPATNTWKQKRDMPSVRSVPGDPYSEEYVPAGGGVTGVINGKLYVVSGCFSAQEPWGYFECYHPLFFRYNVATDQWVTLPAPFTEPAYGPSVGGVIAGKFYVMAQSPYTHDAFFAVYDPATNKWTARTPLGLPRPGAASAVLGNKLYVIGGFRYNAARDAMDTLDITIVYDPVTDAWTRRAPLPSARANISAATVLLNGKPRIEVVGGHAPGNNLQYVP